MHIPTNPQEQLAAAKNAGTNPQILAVLWRMAGKSDELAEELARNPNLPVRLFSEVVKEGWLWPLFKNPQLSLAALSDPGLPDHLVAVLDKCLKYWYMHQQEEISRVRFNRTCEALTCEETPEWALRFLRLFEQGLGMTTRSLWNALEQNPKFSTAQLLQSVTAGMEFVAQYVVMMQIHTFRLQWGDDRSFLRRKDIPLEFWLGAIACGVRQVSAFFSPRPAAMSWSALLDRVYETGQAHLVPSFWLNRILLDDMKPRSWALLLEADARIWDLWPSQIQDLCVSRVAPLRKAGIFLLEDPRWAERVQERAELPVVRTQILQCIREVPLREVGWGPRDLARMGMEDAEIASLVWNRFVERMRPVIQRADYKHEEAHAFIQVFDRMKAMAARWSLDRSEFSALGDLSHLRTAARIQNKWREICQQFGDPWFAQVGTLECGDGVHLTVVVHFGQDRDHVSFLSSTWEALETLAEELLVQGVWDPVAVSAQLRQLEARNPETTPADYIDLDKYSY